jgi:hypothetical protein
MGKAIDSLHRRGASTLTRRYEIYYESIIGDNPQEHNYSVSPPGSPVQIYGTGGTQEALGFIFTPLEDFLLSSVDIYLATVGTPSDEIECILWQSFVSTPIDYASNPYNLTDVSPNLYKFRFPKNFLKSGITYVITFERTGARDTSNYRTISCKSSGVAVADRLWVKVSGVWGMSTVFGPYIVVNSYKSEFKHDLELNKRAISLVSDLGKSDIDSKFKAGKGDITFQNKDNYINPSDGGNFELNRIIRFSVIEDYQLVESFDSGINDWTLSTYLQTPQFNFQDQVEGKACFELKHSSALTTNHYMEKTLSTPIDGTDSGMGLTVKFEELTTLVKFNSSTYALRIRIGNDSSNYYQIDIDREDLNTGYNDLVFISWDEFTEVGSVTVTALDYIYFEYNMNDASYEFNFGDFLVDWLWIGNKKDLFTGYSDRGRPQFNVEDKTLRVSLSDMFSPLEKAKVSIGLQTSKKVSEIVIALLNAASFNSDRYTVNDDDTTILNTVTWDDVGVKNKLDECVEVGQHHHYVDGSGIYRFESNQWLEDPTPDFIYNLEDMDDYNFEFDLKGIYNQIRVHYPVSQITNDEDRDSILRYGRRTRELDNELMPSGGAYASGISLYMLDQLSNNRKGVEFTLKNRFPDIIDLEIGKIVDIINPFTGNYDKYAINAMNRKVDNLGNHDVKYKAGGWVSPSPITEWYDLVPFDKAITEETPSDRQTSYGESQGFLVTPTTGTIWHLKVYAFQRVAGIFNFTASIYNVDGAGKPTGSALATSEPVPVGGSAIPMDIVFPFTGSDRITLTNGNNYAWIIELSGGGITRLWGFMGINSDIYSGGVPAWKNIGGTWTVLPHDRWFSIRLKV